MNCEKYQDLLNDFVDGKLPQTDQDSIETHLSVCGVQTCGIPFVLNVSSVQDGFRQQEQVVAYWNQRVELNKARWNPQMRETFDRNMSLIDAAVNDSMSRLTQNPHDEVSEEILNAALNDKVELLKEFADL